MPVLDREASSNINNNFIFIAKNGNIQEASKLVIKYSRYSLHKKLLVSKMAVQYARQFDWDTIAKKEFKIISQFVVG